MITYVITLSLKKEIIGLEKFLEKVLNFTSKNRYEPCYWPPFFVIDLGFISVHKNKTNKQKNLAIIQQF